MKVHQVEQGSPEWHALRLGIPTASEFHKIITPTGKLSEQSRTYAYKLIAEKLLNRTLDALDNLEHVERGKLLEPQAAAAYEFERGVKTEKVGFVTTDDGRIGASPDRFVGRSGILEIKCPAPNTQVGYLLEGFGSAYHVQVQGQLWVAEKEWSDRYAYSTELPSLEKRSHRDEPFIRAMSAAVDEFCDRVAAMMERVRASGFFQDRAQVQTPIDQAAEQWERTPWGAPLWGERADHPDARGAA